MVPFPLGKSDAIPKARNREKRALHLHPRANSQRRRFSSSCSKKAFRILRNGNCLKGDIQKFPRLQKADITWLSKFEGPLSCLLFDKSPKRAVVFYVQADRFLPNSNLTFIIFLPCRSAAPPSRRTRRPSPSSRSSRPRSATSTSPTTPAKFSRTSLSRSNRGPSRRTRGGERGRRAFVTRIPLRNRSPSLSFVSVSFRHSRFSYYSQGALRTSINGIGFPSIRDWNGSVYLVSIVSLCKIK